jgi:hypothetical protein
MSIAVSNVSQTQPVPPPTRTSTPKPTKAESKPVHNTDTVELSPAAQAKIAASKQTTETPAQTKPVRQAPTKSGSH